MQCSPGELSKSLGTEVIYNEILNNRGTQFDPEIADVFLKLLDENRLEINEDYNEIVEKSWLQSLCSRIMDILFSWIWII